MPKAQNNFDIDIYRISFLRESLSHSFIRFSRDQVSTTYLKMPLGLLHFPPTVVFLLRKKATPLTMTFVLGTVISVVGNIYPGNLAVNYVRELQGLI